MSWIDGTLREYADEEVVEHDGERRDEVGEHVGEKNDGENELTQTAGEETVVSTELESAETSDAVVVGVDVGGENDGKNELVQTTVEKTVAWVELGDETLDLSNICAEFGERVEIDDWWSW